MLLKVSAAADWTNRRSNKSLQLTPKRSSGSASVVQRTCSTLLRAAGQLNSMLGCRKEASISSLTLYTFGYWGWGNSTDKLVQAVDAAEDARGYRPPMFVDIRIRRSVRARGFNGNTFERLLGNDRYKWMDGLGNMAIVHGGPTRLKDLHQAAELLSLAVAESAKHRHVIIFCACEKPGSGGPDSCHRVLAAKQIQNIANRLGKSILITEWPGGEPKFEPTEIKLSAEDYAKAFRGSKWIPMGNQIALGKAAGMPWFSPLRLTSKGAAFSSMVALVGPCRFRKSAGYLPLLESIDTTKPDSYIRNRIIINRRENGYA